MKNKVKAPCPTCGGHRYIRVEPRSKIPGIIVPGGAFVPCPDCTYTKRIFQNIERAWPNLFRAPKLESASPLLELTESNVWVTAGFHDFRMHLKHVAIRKGTGWDFKVVSDKTMMKAEFANMSIRGVELLDPDLEDLEKMAPSSLQALTLSDLVEPPELLIIQMGVKGRNSYMPQVLLETLSQRDHLSKKTWIWDQPHKPLNENHYCYSQDVADFLQVWEYKRVRIKVTGETKVNHGNFNMENEEEDSFHSFTPSLSELARAHRGSTKEKGPDKNKKTKKTS